MSCLHHLSKGLSLPPQLGAAIIERLSTFSSLFTLYLSTLHDAELYCELEGNHTPFTTKEIVDMVAVLRDCFINLQLEKHLPSSMFLGHRAKTTRPSVQVRIHVVYCDCVYIWVCIVWVCANKYLLNSVNLGHYTCRMKRGSTYRLLNCLCFKQFNLCLAYTSCVTKIICNLLHCHSCTYSSALL